MDQVKKQKDIYKDMQIQILERLLLSKVIQKEIEKENFKENTFIKQAKSVLLDQRIVEIYIEKELFNQIKVTEKEKNAFYAQHQKRLNNLQMDYLKLSRLLEDQVKKQKLTKNIELHIGDLRDSSIIPKNREVIKKYIRSS